MRCEYCGRKLRRKVLGKKRKASSIPFGLVLDSKEERDALEQALKPVGEAARAKFEDMSLGPPRLPKKVRRELLETLAKARGRKTVDRALAVPDFKKICEHVLDKKP